MADALISGGLRLRDRPGRVGVPLGHARAALRRLQQHRGSQKSPVWTYLFDVIESFLLGLILKHFSHFLLLTF